MLQAKKSYNEQTQRKKIVLGIETEKISKTLVASNSDFMAQIDNIFMSIHLNSINVTVRSLLPQKNSVVKCFSDLFEMKRTDSFVLVHLICHIP